MQFSMIGLVNGGCGRVEQYLDFEGRSSMAEKQVYPKLVAIIETTRSDEELALALDPSYDSAKAQIRQAFASDTRTTIKRWHFHLSTGAVDEDEV